MTGFDDDLKRHLQEAEGAPASFGAVLARVERRRSRRRAATLVGSGLAVAALVATAVGLSRPDASDTGDTVRDPGTAASSSTPTSSDDPRTTLGAVLPGEAETFHWGDDIYHFLAEDGRVLDASPWTACMSGPPDESGVSTGGCWDGAPELSQVHDAGSPEALWFSFDYPGWEFEHVTFQPQGQGDCGRTMSVEADKISDRVFRIDPVGPAGTYRVDVFGYGADGGDAVTSVLWTTTRSTAGPEPRATGSLFTDEDGDRVAPYGGPDLHFQELADTPEEASAVWTVTDEAGHTVSIPLRRTTQRCQGVGNVSFTGRELTSAELASLRGDRVTYTVTVTLDGTEHVGTAVWPDDENDDAPSVDLIFDPPLPRYAG